MAKKNELESDDWDIDGGLDMPDFDFDGPSPKDDRNPATKVAVAAAEGFRDSALSSDNLRTFVKGSLPRGYGETIDLADHTASSLRNLYNTTAKELKPVVNDIKKTSARLVPVADKVLPKTLAEKFSKFTTIENKPSLEQSLEDAKEASLQAELGAVFEAQAKETQEYRAEQETQGRLRDSMAFKRHKESSDILNQISQSTQELAAMQRTVGMAFQRKSLELQFRHYFVARDMLEETKKQNAINTTALENIVKNTGLPEFVKLKNSERIGEAMRNRFIGAVGDSMSNMRRNFVRNFTDRVGKGVQNKVREVGDGVRAGLGAVDSLAELQEMQSQFGPARSGAETGAELLGGMGATAATNRIAKWVYGKTSQNEKIAKTGNMLTDLIAQLPQRALRWANSYDGIGKGNFGQGSGWLDFFKDQIKGSLPSMDTTMEGDKLTDIRNPDMFNRRTNRSITDIIPGFLARIYRELKIIRTGDANQELTEFDYTTNKFSDKSTVKKNILNSLIDSDDKSSAKRDVDEIVNSIDTKNQLTTEQKRALGKLMLKNNMKNGVGDSKVYSNADAQEYSHLNREDAEAMANVFKEFFGDDAQGFKQTVFGRQFSRLGDGLSDKRAMVQDFMNANQKEHLVSLGLVDEKTNEFNIEKFYDYILDAEHATEGPARRTRQVPSQTLEQYRDNGYRQTTASRDGVNGAVPTASGLPRGDSVMSGGFSQYAPTSGIQEWGLYRDRHLQQKQMASHRWQTGPQGGSLEEDHSAQNWSTYTNKRKNKANIPLTIMPTSQYGFTSAVGGVNAAPSLPPMLTRLTTVMQDLVEEVQEVQTEDNRVVANRMRQVADSLPDGRPGASEPAPLPRDASPSVQNVTVDNTDVIRAIEEHSAKKPAETLNDIVLRIEQKLNEGITLNGVMEGSTGGAGGKKALLDRSLREHLAGGRGAFSKGFGWMKDQFIKSGQRTKRMGGWLWDKASVGANFLADKANELNDVYIRGEVMPRLTKAKLLAGEYYVEGKEGAIKSLKGIKENIYDKDGNLVISAEDLKNAFQKTGIGQGIMSAFGSVGRFAKKQWERGMKFVPASYRWAAEWGAKGLKGVNNLLDLPQDVYVVGKPNPVLTAITMKGGGYKDRATGNPVTRVSEIKGPVVDDTGNTVLTDEDIAAGLIDKHGKKIVTGFTGLAVRAGRALKWSYDKVMGGMKRAKDWTFDKLGKLKDGLKTGEWGISADLSIGARSKHTVTLLHQIRDMLNDRLPGERTTFAEIDFQDGITNRTGAAIKKLKDKLGEKMPGWSEKLKAKRDELREKKEGWKERFLDKKESLKDKWREKRGEGSLLDFFKRLTSGKPTDLFNSAKDRAKEARAKAKEKYDNISESITERNERFAKLKEKKDALAERLAEKKEKAKEKAEELKQKGRDKLDAIREKFAAAREKAREKREAEEAAKEDDDGGINIDLGGDGGGNEVDGRGKKKKKPRSKWRRRLARGKMGRAARAFGRSGAGRFLGGAGRAAMGVGRVGLGLAMGSGSGMLAGLGGAASGAAGMLGGAASMIGTGLAGVGSLAMGAGGALMSGAAAIGSVISAPVILGALAVGALGYGAYKAYQYFSRHKLGTFSKVRYVQYGFSPQDEDHLQAVFGLEDSLKDAVVMNGEVASLDDSKVDTKKILETFGIEIGDHEQIEKFAAWFAHRFKPVFLTNVAAIRAAAPSKWLGDVDDLDNAEKRKYLNVAKFPGGPYNVFTSPFADQRALPSGAQEVASAVAVAEAELQQAGETDGKAGAAAAAGAAGVAAGAAALKTAAGNDGLPSRAGGPTTLGAAGAMVAGDKLAQLSQETLGGVNKEGGNVVTVSGPMLAEDLFNTGSLDAMTAIRYKTYGLKELETDKVRALALTEAETLKRVEIVKGVATFKGAPEQMLIAMGSAFGVVGANNNAAYDWITWFNMRFLPTYLTYLTAICTATKKSDVRDAQLALTNMQALEVASITYTAKSLFSGASESVWLVPISPWPGYMLNNDVTSTDGNMQGLKNKAKQSKVSEESGRAEKRGMEGGSSGAALAAAAAGATTPNRPQDQPGFFSKIWGGSDGKGGLKGMASTAFGAVKSVNDAIGNAVTGAASSAWQGAKQALGFGGGMAMNHPGGGTGGDINQIPLPSGNGTWNAVKDTIVGAARMVGMDEKMMAAVAAIESGFNWSVKAGTSSATGLFQFIKSTWDSMIKKYGPKYGIDPSTPPTDPRANALMGGEYLKQNAEALKKVITDRPITDTDLYMAHFLGAGGASQFFKADPNAIAAQVLPKAAASNIPIFYQDGRPRTIAEVYALMNNKVRTRGKQFGIDDGSEKMVASPTKAPTSAPSAQTGAKATTMTPGSTAGATAPAGVSASMAASEGNPSQNIPAPGTAPKAAPQGAAMAGAVGNIGVDNSPPAMQAQRSQAAAQQQMQRDMAAERLIDTNRVLEESLTVQKDIRTAVQDLAKLVKADMEGRAQARAQGALKEPVKPATPVAPTQQPARPMTPAPVSMRKSTSY